MATRSSKHRALIPSHIVPEGGLNAALPASAIADNELVIATNWWYSSKTGKLTVRPGVEYAAASDLAASPTNCHWYVKDATTAFLIVSCNNDKIYYLDDSDAWQELTTIGSSGTTPAFLTFNGRLLIADGSGLYGWDGVTTSITITTITTSIKPDALHEIANRVVANDTADYDSVYLSGPNDEDDWDTSSGSAVGLRAGYGDGLRVNAFAVFGMDLIISKTGVGKKIYRLNVANADPDNWYVAPLINDAAADHAEMIAEVHNDVFLVDTGSLRSIAGVVQYGDLQIVNAGLKVNPLIYYDYLDGDSPYFVRHMPAIDKVFIGYGEKIYVFHIPRKQFTKIMFSGKSITTAVCAGDDVYLLASTGELYKLNESLYQDELSDGSSSDYEATVQTKRFTFMSAEGIVRRVDVSLETVSEGEAVLELILDGSRAVSIKTINLADETDYYGDATGYYGSATDLYGDTGTPSWIETSHNRTRSNSFAVQLRTTSGRCAVERFDIISALVNG